MIDIAIHGAAGYGGQELLRLLAGHTHFHVAAGTSHRFAGRTAAEAIPQLEGFFPDLRLQAPEQPLPESCQAAILATPHGISHQIFAELHERHPDMKVVDLSGDFRLKSPERFYSVYGAEHRFPEMAPQFAYGLTETNREAIAAARFVANPGCFATGAVLALAPLAEKGLLTGDVTLAQTTGSSGSGALPKDQTHHPERAQDMHAYKTLAHQHEPEIDEELRRIAGGAKACDVAMVPQSGPFSRGIFTVAHVKLLGDVEIEKIYLERYRDEPFVRLRSQTPTLRHVVRSNFCDIAVHTRGRRVVVLSAIDNLVKGMAGQAIQNLNVLFGLEETAGLMTPGANP